MRSALAHALLVAGLALVAPAQAQFGMPSPALQADSHIFSAFTTRSDPHVLADDVKLGRTLRRQLGADANAGQVYDALMASVAGKAVRSNSVPAAQAAGYATLGVNGVDPLVIVEADDVRLLLQYSVAAKNVTFVEQLAGTPVVERPLPTEAPAAATVAPAAAAKPKPASKPAVATPTPPVPAPRVAPVVAAPAAAPKASVPAKPRGDCVIKPVMTEEDMWNCSAPGQASNPLVSTPAPAPAPAAATASPAFAPAPAAASSAPRECVVKPVMTEEDLRACAAERRSQPVTAKEVSVPAAAPAAPPVAGIQIQTPPRECVIKPVMSEEDLRACVNVRRSSPVIASEPAAVTPASAPAPAAVSSTPPAPRECVVKPVMTEDELRACGSRR